MKTILKTIQLLSVLPVFFLFIVTVNAEDRLSRPVLTYVNHPRVERSPYWDSGVGTITLDMTLALKNTIGVSKEIHVSQLRGATLSGFELTGNCQLKEIQAFLVATPSPEKDLRISEQNRLRITFSGRDCLGKNLDAIDSSRPLRIQIPKLIDESTDEELKEVTIEISSVKRS